MVQSINNAAPMTINRGTQDLSKRQVPRVPVPVPQHLPKVYLFGQKGPDEAFLASTSDLTRILGDETFNYNGKFANHATVFAQGAAELANTLMVKRLRPTDAGPNANIIAWLDVLTTMVDVYQRNPDGSLVVNPTTGEPVIVNTAAGHQVKWVLTYNDTESEANTFGQLTSKQGDQTNQVGNQQSTRYPIFEIRATSFGSFGNLCGLRLSAPTYKSNASMPSKMMNTQYAYPYNIQMIQRPDALSTPVVIPTIFNEQNVMFTFKPGVKDPVANGPMYAGDVIIQSYENLTDQRYAKVYGPYHDFHVYDNYIDELVTKFHAAEIPFIGPTSDFTADPAQRHLFNFVTGVSSQNVPYNSFVFVDGSDTTRWGESTNVYSNGGSDGTMNDEVYAQLLEAEVAQYADPMSPLQEMAVNVESHLYDTGVPLDTKYELIKFIALRPDTFVTLSTHDVNERKLTAGEEASIAISLRTRLQLHPESDYFGTPVMRGSIHGRSAVIRNSEYKKRMPLTYEVMRKRCRYMGAGDGRWKNGQNYDGAPGSILVDMTDVSITWVPSSVRNRNWDLGLNWVQAYDTESLFFPAIKTVYNDDTSVLTSDMIVQAICQLQKIIQASWREFSGESYLTEAQLCKRVNDYITNNTNNRFDGRFVIVPDCQITDMDSARGFSWTVPVKIYGDNMKTVATTYIQAFRRSDLAQTTTA